MSSFLDPVSQVSYKVKEEVAVRNADDLHEGSAKYSNCLQLVRRVSVQESFNVDKTGTV